MKHDSPVIRKITVTRSPVFEIDRDGEYTLDGIMTYDERRLTISNAILQEAGQHGRVECEIECVNTSHGSMKRVGQVVRRGEGSNSNDTNYSRWVGPDVAVVHDSGRFSAIVAPVSNPFAESDK